MEQLDQMLIGLILQLPQEAKVQLLEMLQPQGMEEQALGQAMQTVGR